jgi:hypothetical protein
MPLNLRRYTAAIEHDLLLAKTQSGKARIAILQLAAFLFLALSVSFAQAQSLVDPTPLQNTAFEHRVLPYEATISGFINFASRPSCSHQGGLKHPDANTDVVRQLIQ